MPDNKPVPVPVQLALKALEILAAEDAALAEESRKKLPGFALRLAAAGEEVTVDGLLASARAKEIDRVPEPQQRTKTYEEIVAQLTAVVPAEERTYEGIADLNYAAHNGRLDKVKYLTEKFRSNNMDYFDDALILAAKAGHLDIVKHLVEDCRLNVHSQKVAFRVASYGHLEVLKYFMEDCGVNHRVMPSFMDDLLQAAAGKGQLDIVKYLMKTHNNFSLNAFANAAKGHLDVVKYFVEEAGLPEKHKAHMLMTATRSAAKAGQLDIVKYLVEERGAEFSPVNYYKSAISAAMHEGQLHIVRYFVEKHGFTFSNNNATRALRDMMSGEEVWSSIAPWKLSAAKYLITEWGANCNGHPFPIVPEKVQVQIRNYLTICEIWQRVAHCEPPNALYTNDPAYFKSKAYESVYGMLKREGHASHLVYPMAFQAAGLFGTEDRVLQYLEKWGKADKQPLHEIIQMINLPAKKMPEMDLKAWGDAVLKCGPSMANLVKFADRLPVPEKSDDGKTWSMRKTRERVAEFVYERAKENPVLAAICMEHGVKENAFNEALEISAKPPAVKNIPDITIEGTQFDLPGATFKRLAANDVRGLFLGEMTDCCQSIGGAGAKCAKHGFISENSGFYVVENAKGRVVGQTWAWRGEKGELVFDSLETLGKNVSSGQWQKLAEAFKGALDKKPGDITAFHIGTGGATPTQLIDAFNSAAKPVKPLGYDGYRDSHKQVVVWSAGRRTKP